MTDSPSPLPKKYDQYPIDAPVLIRLLLTGMIVGALGWLMYLGISSYFIEPVFCRNAETFAVCRNGGTIAWVTAHVIIMIVAVAVLARMAVYRPLLVVLGVLASLWAAHAWLGALEWYIGAVWQAVLFGAAFVLFGLVARISNFVVTVIVTLLLAVLARLIIVFT